MLKVIVVMIWLWMFAVVLCNGNKFISNILKDRDVISTISIYAFNFTMLMIFKSFLAAAIIM